jgi:hypothetical protein
MAEDKKKKSGLHKRISSIFEGVPLPQPGGLQPPPPASGVPSPDQPCGIPEKPLPPPFQTRVPGTSRPYEAGQPLPRDAPVSQHKANIAGKATGPSLWQQIKNKLITPKPGASGTRQKVMLVLVPVLIVVFIFVVGPLLLPPKKVPKDTQAKLPTTVAGASTETEIKWEIPPPYPETLRDPMQPAASAAVPEKTVPEIKEVETVKPQKLVVKGILYSGDNPSAIIGTQIVHEGEKVSSGATVIKINKGSVEFEMDGKKWEQNVEP